MAPPRGVSFKWLDEHLWSRLEEWRKSPLVSLSGILNKIKVDYNQLKNSPKSLPVNGLSLHESLQMFRLTFKPEYKGFSLLTSELYPIPDLLTNILNEHMFVTQGSVANEALARSGINNILVVCIAEEKRLALQPKNSGIASSASSSSRPTTPTPNPAPLFLQYETKLNYEVTYKNESRMLQGSADYSLWYDVDEIMGTNLVLVEAKRGVRFLRQRVSWWRTWVSIVHRTREAQQKRDKVIYGLSTDGNQFQFWCLDNDSVLTQSRIYGWAGGDGSRIVTYTRLITRAAIHSTPTTTPVKGVVPREVSLRVFSNPDSARTLDYGIGRLSVGGEGGSGEEDDIELVDAPEW